jgi:hypothetical protein
LELNPKDGSEQFHPADFSRVVPEKVCHDASAVEMRSESRLLIIAGVMGGFLGVTVAWTLTSKKTPKRASVVSVSRPQDARSSLVRTVTQAPSPPVNNAGSEAPSQVPATEPSATEPTTDTSATATVDAGSSPSPHEAVFSFVTWTPPTNVKLAEDGCISGDALACLGLGELYLSTTEKRAAKAGSQSYFERAFSILVFKCNHREPDACVTIARMHEYGRGIPKNEKAAATLVTYAQELCRNKPGKVCATWTK